MDTFKPKNSEDEKLAEGVYYIRNPFDLSERLEGESMWHVMRFWKGFNTPYMKGDSFVQSETRLKKYMQDKFEKEMSCIE